MATIIKAEFIELLQSLDGIPDNKKAIFNKAFNRLKQDDIIIPQETEKKDEVKDDVCLFLIMLFHEIDELMTPENKRRFHQFAEKMHLTETLKKWIDASKHDQADEKFSKLIWMCSVNEEKRHGNKPAGKK